MDPTKRKPGGQPVDEENRLIGRSMRFKQRQLDKIDAAGMEWLRDLVDKAPMPKTPSATKPRGMHPGKAQKDKAR